MAEGNMLYTSMLVRRVMFLESARSGHAGQEGYIVNVYLKHDGVNYDVLMDSGFVVLNLTGDQLRVIHDVPEKRSSAASAGKGKRSRKGT